jgi:hypothetical protein
MLQNITPDPLIGGARHSRRPTTQPPIPTASFYSASAMHHAQYMALQHTPLRTTSPLLLRHRSQAQVLLDADLLEQLADHGAPDLDEADTKYRLAGLELSLEPRREEEDRGILQDLALEVRHLEALERSRVGRGEQARAEAQGGQPAQDPEVGQPQERIPHAHPHGRVIARLVV